MTTTLSIGISKAYSGVLSSLEITYSLYNLTSAHHGALFVSEPLEHSAAQQQQEAFDFNRAIEEREKLTFKEVEIVKAVYQDRKVVLSRREGVVVF